MSKLNRLKVLNACFDAAESWIRAVEIGGYTQDLKIGDQWFNTIAVTEKLYPEKYTRNARMERDYYTSVSKLERRVRVHLNNLHKMNVLDKREGWGGLEYRIMLDSPIAVAKMKTQGWLISNRELANKRDTNA